MNHGICANCFWYKWGHCFMSNNDTGKNSYCPDYYNRERTKKTLKDSINNWLAKGQLSAEDLERIKQKYNEMGR